MIVYAFLTALLGSITAHAETVTSGAFRNTYYIIGIEADYPSSPVDVPILGLDLKPLAWTSKKYKRILDLEGSGLLLSGQVANFAARNGTEILYRFTRHQFGLGVGNCPLAPFRSIAVDPEMIPLGSKVFIQETVGMVLPDGSVHDGYWDAIDIGSAIKKDRIDLYVGLNKHAETLTRAKITHLQALHLSWTKPEHPLPCLTEDPQ
jgi:3D (Asp-Asp-Asp) domain-containing protein